MTWEEKVEQKDRERRMIRSRRCPECGEELERQETGSLNRPQSIWWCPICERARGKGL